MHFNPYVIRHSLRKIFRDFPGFTHTQTTGIWTSTTIFGINKPSQTKSNDIIGIVGVMKDLNSKITAEMNTFEMKSQSMTSTYCFSSEARRTASGVKARGHK